MFSGRYGNALTVVLVMVIVAIFGIAGWMIHDMVKQNSINNKAQTAVEEFKKVREKVKDKDVDGDSNLYIGNTVTSAGMVGNKRTYLENYEVKGIIEIPKTKVEYPILSEVTKRSLEIAVAILHGPGLNEVGNTVILGHNYRNSLFFSDNDLLTNGDEILITDQSGQTITYVIYNMYETDPDDAEYMLRDTGNSREISLSTCTDDSKARLVIWAKEKESKSIDVTQEIEQVEEKSTEEEQ